MGLALFAIATRARVALSFIQGKSRG
jgi:hypothetical protein